MTDLATQPAASDDVTETIPHGAEQLGGSPTEAFGDAADAEETRHEAKPSRKKMWLGIGIPVGSVVALGSAAALVSTIVFAPGTTILGAPVGLTMPGSAQQTVADHLAGIPITVTVDGHSATVSGADLGLSVDADAAVEQAFADYPAWRVDRWYPEPLGADLAIDQEQATDALRAAIADAYVDPVNAQVVLDGDSYTVVPGEQGRSIDADALAASIEAAMSSSDGTATIAAGTGAAAQSGIAVEATLAEIEPAFTTTDAEDAAEQLNGMLDGVDFALEGDVVDTAPRSEVASWLEVSTTDDGTLDVSADAEAIQSYVDELAGRVEQEAVDAEIVVNASGATLRTVVEGQDGYRVTSTEGTGEAAAEQLAELGDATIALTGEKVAHETTELYRRAVVSLSDGRSYFYETVNGGEEKLVRSMAHAVGRPGYDTRTGDFTVQWQTPMQNMGSCDANGNYVEGLNNAKYCTADVPWVSYFNGNQGFHGTYWHNNYGPGARMSHGCVNLTVSDAEWSYRFLQVGTPVSVVA